MRRRNVHTLVAIITIFAASLVALPIVALTARAGTSGGMLTIGANATGTSAATGSWTVTGTKFGCSTTESATTGMWACVQPQSDDGATTYVAAPNVAGAVAVYFNLNDMPADFGGLAGINISATGASAAGTAGVSYQLFKSDGTTALTTSTATFSKSTSYTSDSEYVTVQGSPTLSDMNGAQLKVVTTRGATGNTLRLTRFVVSVSYYTSTGTLAQSGYIWQNDDQAGSAIVDSNTVQAAGNTAITGVEQGERLTARVQLTNSGEQMSQNLGLFYDRNDGIFTKVQSNAAAISGAGDCADDTDFSCTLVNAAPTLNVTSTSTAIDSGGHPWVAYTAGGNLMVARYVGSGGNCTSAAWSCFTVTTGIVASMASLAFTSDGDAIISYYDQTNGRLKAAMRWFDGGNSCGTSTEWTCSTIVNSLTMDTANGDNTSVLVDGWGSIYVGWHNNTTGKTYQAEYWGGGGNCVDNAMWNGCVAEIDNATAGEFITATPDKRAGQYRAWWTTGNVLKVAQSTAGTGCTSAAWTCSTVDTAAGRGGMSIAMDAAGKPWVVYRNTSSQLRVARYLGDGTGGNAKGCGVGSNTDWQCSTVDTGTGSLTDTPSLQFDAAGQAWIAYYQTAGATHKLSLARYAGTGGSCTGNTAWTCTSLESANDVGNKPSLAFGFDGTIWVSHGDNTAKDLRISNLNRRGEILPSPSLAASTNGSSIQDSHADMASATDSTNKADSDCLVASTTWNNGKLWTSGEGSGLIIPTGTSTKQCTEAAFTIETSSALANTTYRFVVASGGGVRPEKASWLGPSSVAYFPTFTTDTNTPARYAKDANPTFANCTDTAWGCATVSSTGTVGNHSSIAFDPNGTAWTAFYDTTNGDLEVAKYVGVGGTGCASATWSCTTVDAAYTTGSHPSLAFDTAGNPWIAYQDTSYYSMHMAKFVGSGGSGCTSTAWTCESIKALSAAAEPFPSLAFDTSGNAWVAFYEGTGLVVAHYVGGSGSGCAIAAWTCTTVDQSTTNAGKYPSLTFDKFGIPWVAYYDVGLLDLRIARWVGSGGNCTVSAAWTCTTIDNTGGDTGLFPSLGFDNTGVAWISYYDNNNGDLRVAKNVGSGGTGCSVGVTWTCWAVDATGDRGYETSLAMDAQGIPWVVSFDNTASDLRVARYVGSGGTGCSVGATWTCSTIDSAGAVGYWPTIAFDASGLPWTSYWDSTNGDMKVAKLHTSIAPLSNGTSYSNGPRNARSGDARVHLDAGLSPRPSTCAATTNAEGICGVTNTDADYDAMTAQINESPIYTAALQASANTSFPSAVWVGQSTAAASSKNVKIEVYRFGSTNAWTTLATNSAAAANVDFTLTGTAATGTAAEYWQADGSNWVAHYRVSQVANTIAQTLKTNKFALTNRAPNPPSVLAQTKTTTTPIPGTTSFAFDSTAQGWATSAGDGNGSADSAAQTSSVTRTGAGALALTMASTQWGRASENRLTPYDASANGSVFSAWVFLPATNTGTLWRAALSVHNGALATTTGSTTNLISGKWTLITVTAPPSYLTDLTYIDVYAEAGGANATGSNLVYIDDVQQGGGIWTNETSVRFTGTVSDLDNPDTDQLCIEAQPIASAFTNTEQSCGAGVAYSGTGVTAVHTLASLTNGTQYHWQARTKDAAGLYSSWVAYGGNVDTTTASPDFGIDTTAPTAGTTTDGTSPGVDVSLNNGALDALSATWTGFSDAASGIVKYERAVGTTAGGTQTSGWTLDASLSATTISSLLLRTSQMYYISVRAVDAAGNTSAAATTNGQRVAPSLSFSLDTSVIAFANLKASNSFTDTKTITASTSTNGYNGYVIRQFATGPLTSTGGKTVSTYAGTWATPTVWSGTGLGYTSSDALVQGSNRFGTATKYAGMTTTKPGDIVADNTSTVVGTPITNDTFALTYRVTVPSSQAAGRYQTTISLAAIPTF